MSDERRFGFRRTLVFGAITVLAVLGVGLVVGEFVLRQQRAAVEGSDRPATGMFSYDRDLGWRLIPGWSGRHRHHDFDAGYRIGPEGYRGQFRPAGRWVAVVGDSFTFGFGVEDDETFVAVLDRAGGADTGYLNFGMPGFSTDQEMLLIEGRLPQFTPQQVLLVVYLGNDLADNQRAFPLQLENAKPYFELDGGKLLARNSPVPKTRKPADDRATTLGRLILAGAEIRPTFWQRLLGRLETPRRLGLNFAPRPDLRAHFERRLAPSVTLFKALVTRARRSAGAFGADLRLVLLPGRSFVVDQGSISAQYQDVLRRAIVAWGKQAELPVIDAAAELRRRHDGGRRDDFYPNEGHLTATGHGAVAAYLQEALKPPGG